MVISGQTNYEGQNLSFQDFSEQTLTNANFKDANLNSADFSGATLTGADFSGANLDGASFENAVITGVNFSNTNVASAYFGGVTSGGITGTPSSINNYKLIGGYIVGAAAGTGDVKLSDAVFEGTVSELLDFTNTTFQDGDLTGVQFTHIDFTGANFTNTILTNTVFTNVTFSDITSGGITGTPSALPDAYKIVSGYILAPQSNLMTANLAGADLSNMDLSGANFRYGSLTGANLNNTNLTGANLSNTTMTGIIGRPQALPSGYQLIDGSIVLSTSDTAVVEEIFNQITSRTTVPSDLKGTTVTFNPASKILPTEDTKYATRPDTVTVTVSKGSETETKTFEETVSADLTGANLTGFNFTGIDLTGAIFSGATLNGADFTNANVTNTSFTSATLTGATFTGTTMTGAIFSGATLNGADFTNANVTNASFTSATLTGATFTGTTMTGADLTSAILREVISGTITGTPTLPTGYNLVKETIIGTAVNLTNADLSGQDLTGIDLTDATLTKANLENATLINATLTNATLTGATLTGATLTGLKSGNIQGTPASLPTDYKLALETIVGPNVDLTDGDLTNENLMKMNLTGVNFTNADLTGVNFILADLTDATLTGATLTGADGPVRIGTYYPLYFTQADAIKASSTSSSHMHTLLGYDFYMPDPHKTFTNDDWKTDLQYAYLEGANFSGLDLTGVNFTGANLTNANLTNANLTNANLTNANLTSANITGATLTGATLTGATLTGTTMTGIIGTPQALPTGYQLVGGSIVLITNEDEEDVDSILSQIQSRIQPSDLKGTTVTYNPASEKVPSAETKYATETYTVTVTVSKGSVSKTTTFQETVSANLTDADLTGFDFTGVNLTDANFTNATLTNATLTNANFTDAILTRVKSGGIIGTPQTLPTNYILVKGYIIGRNVDLTGADLSGADLTDANLTSADLANANLTGATLTGVILTTANLTGATMTSIVGTPQALPDGYEMLDQAIVLTSNITADVNIVLNQIFADRTLPSDLRGTSVTFDPESKKVPTQATKYATETYTVTVTVSKGSVSNTTTFQETVSANLTGADLTGFDFTNVNLTDANFTNVNFTNATFTGATLTNANFTGATFTGVISGNIQGTPQTLPTNYKVANGYIVGPGVNLTGEDLTGFDFTGADLTGATLTGANLTGEDLTDFDFTGVNLTGANFTNATLTNVTLTNANLTDATLNGVKSGGIQGTPQTLPTNYKVVKGYIVGPGVNLSGADLTGFDFTGANLTDANFTNATLTNVTLTNANFTGATFTGVISGNIQGTPQTLPTNYKIVNGYIVGPGVNLSGADLKGATLGNVDLSGADLTGATLTNATLYKTNLNNANLEGATLNNVNLVGATLTNANFTGATLNGVKSGGIIGTPQKLPSKYTIIKGYIIGPIVDLRGANLTGADLTGVDVSGSYLTNATLTNANLTDATLTGVKSGSIQGTPQTLPTNYKIVKGYLIGPGVNLTDANLSGTYLTSANLTNANLTDANLSGAYFTIATNIEGANLTNANLMDANFPFLLKSGGIIGTPQSLPTNYKLVGGYIIGATVDLRNADLNLLKGADLEDMNLRAILLPENFNLEGANLKNAQLTGRLNKVNLTNANLTNAKLNGNKQDSIQMQFPDGDISSLINDLLQTEPSFQYGHQQQVSYHSIANLSGANLTGAILTGANLTDATVTDIVGTPQALPDGYEMLDQAIVLTSNLRADVNAVYNEIYNKIRNPNFPNDRTLMPNILRGTTVTFDPAEKVPSAETKYATETYTVTITVSKGSVRKETTYRETVTANLTGKDLTGFDFSGANLTGVNFTNANLTRVNFTNANLTNTSLTNANLTNANLTNISGRIIGTPQTLPNNYKVVKTRYTIGPGNYLLFIIGPNVNLTGADLETRDLTGANFSGANLSNASLYSAYLTNANLTNANLSGANLTDATLNGVKSGGIQGTPRSITTNYGVVNGYLMGPNIDLTGANLKDAVISSMNVSLNGANLTRADLRNADLRNVHLYDANLTDANLTDANLNTIPTGTGAIDIPSGGYTNLINANLTRANLTRAKLERADLTRANLSEANLTNAYLYAADLYGANLTDANLTDTDLTDVDLRGVKSGGIIGTPQSLPPSYKLVNGYIVGPNIDLTNVNLSNANLSNVSLFSTNLTNANFTGATFTGVKSGGIIGTPQSLPPSYKIVKGYIIGPNVYLHGANFSNVDLRDADLSNINLSNANLSNANLSNANLSSANLRYTDLSNANLSNANLSSANLSNVNLSNANLTNANFTGATFRRVKSGGIEGTPAELPTNYKIVIGYIIGRNADLSNAILTGMNLSNIDLWDANLSNANLYYANLSNANLRYADLSNANLSNANLSNANLTRANLTNTNLRAHLKNIKSESIIGTPKSISPNYKIVNGYIIGPNADLSNADYSDLSNANLTGMNLTGVNLTGMRLTDANFTNAILTNANLTDANFTNANLTGVKSGNIHFNSEKPPTLPESHKIIKQYIIGNYVNLSYADLMDADLSNVSLIRTNLTNARLDRAYLNRANLTNANLTNARLDSAILTNANLTNANLTNAYFGTDVYLNGSVNLTNANLTNANLSGAFLSFANLTNANFQDTTLSKNTSANNLVSVPRNLPSYADVTRTNIYRKFKVRKCTKYLMPQGPDQVRCTTEERTETRTVYHIIVKTGSEKTGSGRVADGYVNSASGGLFDINDTTNAIETFITDENGNYDLFTPISELPEVYVIIIQPGGIDTSTSSVVNTTMSSTSTRKQAEASALPILHVTPVSTIVTNIIQKADTIDETTVSSAMEQVATKLNISEESIRSDFIADQNSDVAKIVQQIETTVNSMTPALNNTEITEDVVINNISLAIMESDTTFDFSNSNDINKIITNIENSAETITIDESVKSNTSNFITVANTLISDIDTATQTFDDVFTRATQITVASTITANTTGENFTFGFTSPVEPPTISEITSIPITIPAPSFITNICFPGNTPIETDDGYITIKKLVPGHHTIRGQRIVGITKTIAPDEHLICFEKDALGKNVPSQRTLMSKEHKIYYKNKLQEARDFLEDFDLVSKSKYSGEPLYNVLLEYHGIMIVNNMPCETLHPKSLSAKLYTSIRYSSSVREQILAMIHRAIQNKDYKTYRKIMKRI